ncbi:hypothetical protein [Actinomadura bangladeshensis]
MAAAASAARSAAEGWSREWSGLSVTGFP